MAQLPGAGREGGSGPVSAAPQHRRERGADCHWGAGEGCDGVQIWDKLLGLGLMAPPELSVIMNQNSDVNFSCIHKLFIYHY